MFMFFVSGGKFVSSVRRQFFREKCCGYVEGMSYTEFSSDHYFVRRETTNQRDKIMLLMLLRCARRICGCAEAGNEGGGRGATAEGKEMTDAEKRAEREYYETIGRH